MIGEKKSNIIPIIVGIFVAILFLFPIYILATNSFKTPKGIFKDPIGLPQAGMATLDNYPNAVEKMDYATAFTNSVLITLISTVIIIVCASMAAWVLVRYKHKLSTGAFMLFSIAMIIPFQCVMLPLVSIMGQLGFLNPPGLVFMYLGFGSSLAIMLYHGFIKGIPVELEEAAMIDGCSMAKTFWRIVFPLLGPITTTVAIMNIMWIWNDFLLPQLVINTPAWQTLPLKTFYFFGQFSKKWELATAALILGMIPIIIFYLFAQKKIIKGVTDGAIK